MHFSLQAGLTLKDGARTLELTRELDGKEYMLEDVLTRKPIVLPLSELLKRIYSKRYEIVISTPAGPSVIGKQQAVDLTSLTPRERELLDFRLTYVRGLDRQRISRGQRHRISTAIESIAAAAGHSKRPSTSAVMDWARRFQSSSGNPMSLVDRHRVRQRALRLSDKVEKALWQVLRKSYFTKDRQTAKFAHEQLQRQLSTAAKAGEIQEEEAHVSYSTFSRRILDVDLYHRIASREGPARARMVCRTAFPDGVASYALERVEIDHTPLNWVVICDRTGLPLGRPTLTVMIDSYSGYILGFYVSFYGPGLTSVAGVVRNAVLPKSDLTAGAGLANEWIAFGLGDEWVIDNGLEFHSFGFTTMALALGVDLMFCRVRTPWLKPHVERVFGSLNTLSLVKGRVTKTVANVARIDPYKDAAITFSDLVKGLLMFVVDIHPHQPNWRKMATPYELYAESIERTPPALFPGSFDQFRLASGMSKHLTLGQGGIELQGLPYGSVDFKNIVNRHGSKLKLLCKWDPDDMSQLYVRDPDGQTWHTAYCRWQEYASGLSYNQHRLIRQFARADLKASGHLGHLLESKKRLHDHWMDATSRRGRADALKAGRYGDLTSHKVLQPPTDIEGTSTSTDAQRLIVAEEVSFSEQDIPAFEAFSF